METARDSGRHRSGGPLIGQLPTDAVEFAAESPAAGHAAGARPAPGVEPRPVHPPLSPAQERVWVLDRDSQAPARNIPMAVRLTGRLDMPALRRAAEDVLLRHDVLRTRYPEFGGVPYQEILAVGAVLPDGLVVERCADIGGRIAELISTGFDITTQVPVRIRLLTGDDPHDYLLIVVAHRICADGASMTPLVRDLMAAYAARVAGAEPGWAPLEMQYSGFALWHRVAIGSDTDENTVAARQSAYWREQLAGLPELPALPLDRPRKGAAAPRCAVVDFLLPADVHAGLNAVAAQHDSSLVTVVHAALAVLLARVSGNTDVVIGTSVTGRGFAALEDLVGLFANTLALRTTVDLAAPFADLVVQAEETGRAARANADIPFDRVLETAAPGRTAANPLLQVMLSLHNQESPVLELPGLTVAALDADLAAATSDLQIGIEPGPAEYDSPGELGLVFTYATDLFDDDTIDRLGDNLSHILTTVAAEPRIPVRDIAIDGAAPLPETTAQPQVAAPVSAEPTVDTVEPAWASVESAPVTVEPVAAPAVLVPLAPAAEPALRGTALTQVPTSAAEDDPDGPALVRGENAVSYRELDARSSRLARVLIGRGSGPGAGVAVRLERGVESTVATWAVLKAGAAVVPAGAVPVTGLDVKVGLTVGTVPADGIDWLALDDPAVQAEIAAESARPVTYANRVRALRGDDPAFADGATVLGYDRLAAIADRVPEAAALTFESRTYTLGGPESVLALIETVVAGLVGASITLPAPTGGDLTGALADEWVTHLFADHRRLGDIAPAALPDLQGVIADAAPATGQWRASTPVVVLPER